MPRWQPSLDDYVEFAAFLLGAEPETIAALPRIGLAESALHAPFASFGGVEAYPDPIEQAAVLLEHLVKNHPLPDANKRAGFLLTARFLDANSLAWGRPDVELDAGMVERVAAGVVDDDQVVDGSGLARAELSRSGALGGELASALVHGAYRRLQGTRAVVSRVSSPGFAITHDRRSSR